MELTEERLAEIDRHAESESVAPSEVRGLVAEVRRLRNEREDARSLLKQAVSYLYCHEADRVRAWTLEMNRLFVKWADEELRQGTPKADIEGEIKVGDRFIWEPDLPSARQQIVVTQVTVNSDGETWIESVDERGERHWNDESRFREACVRVG